MCAVGCRVVARFLCLGIGHGLKCPRGHERLVRVRLLLVTRVAVLDGETGSVQGGMGGHLDGQFAARTHCHSVFGRPGGDGVGTHGTHAEGDDADGAAEGHARNHVSLAGLVGGAMSLEVSLNDFALLAGIVNGGCCEADANDRHAHGDGEGETRDGRGRGRARDQACVVLPFPLELVGR